MRGRSARASRPKSPASTTAVAVSCLHGQLDQALPHLRHRHRHPLELGLHLLHRHLDVRRRHSGRQLSGVDRCAALDRRSADRRRLLSVDPCARAVARGRLEPQRPAREQHHALRVRRRLQPHARTRYRRPRVQDRHRRAPDKPASRRPLRRGVAGASTGERGRSGHLRIPRLHQRLARRVQHAARLPARWRPRAPLGRMGAQQEPPARHAHRRTHRRMDRLRHHGRRRARVGVHLAVQRHLVPVNRLLPQERGRRQLFPARHRDHAERHRRA